MNDLDKAKILDAILENHGAIITHMSSSKPVCSCDPDVGHVCEECALMDLIRHLQKAKEAVAMQRSHNG